MRVIDCKEMELILSNGDYTNCYCDFDCPTGSFLIQTTADNVSVEDSDINIINDIADKTQFELTIKIIEKEMTIHLLEEKDMISFLIHHVGVTGINPVLVATITMQKR